MEGTQKLVQPFLVIGINHKNVASAPSHVVQSYAGFNSLHAPGHSVDIWNRQSPGTWFIDFIVADLLVQPTHDILVHQPISHPQRGYLARDGASRTPFGNGRVDRGCTWQGLLSLRLRGGHLARPSFPSPSGGGGGGTWQGLLSLHLLLWHRSRRGWRKEVHLEVQLDKMRPTTPPPQKSGVFLHHTPSHPMTFRYENMFPMPMGPHGHRCRHVCTRCAHFVKTHDSPKTVLVSTTTPCLDTCRDPLSYDSHLSRHMSHSPVAKQHISFHLSP